MAKNSRSNVAKKTPKKNQQQLKAAVGKKPENPAPNLNIAPAASSHAMSSVGNYHHAMGNPPALPASARRGSIASMPDAHAMPSHEEEVMVKQEFAGGLPWFLDPARSSGRASAPQPTKEYKIERTVYPQGAQYSGEQQYAVASAQQYYPQQYGQYHHQPYEQHHHPQQVEQFHHQQIEQYHHQQIEHHHHQQAEQYRHQQREHQYTVGSAHYHQQLEPHRHQQHEHEYEHQHTVAPAQHHQQQHGQEHGEQYEQRHSDPIASATVLCNTLLKGAIQQNHGLLPPPPSYGSLSSTQIDNIAYAMWELALTDGNMLLSACKYSAMFSYVKLSALAKLNFLPSWWLFREMAVLALGGQPRLGGLGWIIDDAVMQAMWNDAYLFSQELHGVALA